MRAMISERAGALHYRVQGPADAPAVLFGNSLGSDLRLWDDMLALMPTDLRYVRFDKRGHGLSEPPSAPFSIQDLAADALELVNFLGLERFAYVGVSIGGLIGQALSEIAGDRLASLTLMDTGSQIGSDAMWNERIEKVRSAGLAAMAAPIVDRWVTEETRADRSRVAPMRAMVTATSVEGYAGCCAAIRDADLAAAARKISVPTLCLWGDADLSTPPEVNLALADLISGAERVEIADCGHLPCAERPEEAAAALTDFLARTFPR
ncbi:MAG: 3-oxoadipate enol-lactonase [Neomegalonema sp.]|nr:3-oxoadipate enol-lactonase [Neomegalonema sp.]